jgi:hypothetical protein
MNGMPEAFLAHAGLTFVHFCLPMLILLAISGLIENRYHRRLRR